MSKPKDMKTEIFSGCNIVAMDNANFPFITCVFIEDTTAGDAEYSYYIPWDKVHYRDIANYMNEPENDCKGTSTSGFHSLYSAVKHFYHGGEA